MEGHKFNTQIQKEGESFQSFVADLRILANTREYGILKDNLIRDKTVCGVSACLKATLKRTGSHTQSRYWHWHCQRTIRQNQHYPSNPFRNMGRFGGQFTLSTQLIKPNHLVILSTDAAPQFLQQVTPFIHSVGEYLVT